MRSRKLTAENFVGIALEISFDVSPRDPGLTETELIEMAADLGFGPGEIRDTLRGWDAEAQEHPRYLIVAHHAVMISSFIDRRPWRRVEAFDFVKRELYEQSRHAGKHATRLPLGPLIARGLAANLKEQEVISAVAFYARSGSIRLDGDTLIPRPEFLNDFAPSQQMHLDPFIRYEVGPESEQAVFELVSRAIQRRNDGRSVTAEPLREFENAITRFGLPDYRVWWSHLRAELNLLNVNSNSTSAIVLAAALAEGALGLIAERAKLTQRSMKNELLEPKNWKLADLIKSAKTGQSPILDGDLGMRCIRLNELRQRIHIGRLMSNAYSTQFARPEEAREAVETLERLIRAILMWTEENVK